jgi:hypothetical protein
VNRFVLGAGRRGQLTTLLVTIQTAVLKNSGTSPEILLRTKNNINNLRYRYGIIVVLCRRKYWRQTAKKF